MANPKRETKRERRDEAKRRRLEELRRRQRKERMRRIAMLGGVGVVIAAIILAVTLLGGDAGNTPEQNRLAAAAGCQQVSNPNLITSTHINPPERATYSTNPPTSGKHYNAAGLGPITTGIHRSAVQYEGSVHNLEHGHIVIFYKESVGPAIAGILAEVVRADPQWIMLAPNPDMPFQVAFTAWGHLQGCNTPNAAGLKAAAEDFVDRFKDDAPESARGTPEAGTPTATPPASPVPTTTGSPSPSPTPTGTST